MHRPCERTASCKDVGTGQRRAADDTANDRPSQQVSARSKTNATAVECWTRIQREALVKGVNAFCPFISHGSLFVPLFEIRCQSQSRLLSPGVVILVSSFRMASLFLLSPPLSAGRDRAPQSQRYGTMVS